MIWILFFIGIVDLSQPPILEPVAMFRDMDECFQAREQLVEKIGRPVVDYQVLCVAYDATDEAI